MADDVKFYFRSVKPIKIDEQMLEQVNEFLRMGEIHFDDPDLQNALYSYAEANVLCWDGFDKAKIYQTVDNDLYINTRDWAGSFGDEKIMAFLLSLIIREGVFEILFNTGLEMWGYRVSHRSIEEIEYKPITTNTIRF